MSSFTSAADDVKSGSAISVPTVTGKSVEQAKSILRKAQLDPVVSDDPVYVTYAPAGTVAYSFPGSEHRSTPGSGSCSTSAPDRLRPPSRPTADAGPDPRAGRHRHRGRRLRQLQQTRVPLTVACPTRRRTPSPSGDHDCRSPGQPAASCFFTSAATRPPSAWPAVFGLTTFMT